MTAENPNVSRETFWGGLTKRFLNPAPPPAGIKDDEKAPLEERVCTEKQRLRWEAMILNWGADCQSKLAALAALVKNRPL